MTQQLDSELASRIFSRGLRERQRVGTEVADALRSAIQSGVLQDGVELNQVALAEHFGISRVPVREAMRSLEAEGWITALPHKRAIVQAISPDRIVETFEVRALLEAHLLAKAMARMDDAHVERLTALSQAMKKMTDHAEWVAANREWHLVLLGPAESKMTLELVRQLTSQVERYLSVYGENVERAAGADDEHQDILRAVAARDVDLACALLKAHVGHTSRLVLTALKRTAKGSVPPLPAAD